MTSQHNNKKQQSLLVTRFIIIRILIKRDSRKQSKTEDFIYNDKTLSKLNLVIIWNIHPVCHLSDFSQPKHNLHSLSLSDIPRNRISFFILLL